MKILGIDPGFERIGIAVIEKNPSQNKDVVVFSECFTTSSKKVFSERLYLIGARMIEIVKLYQPEVLAIETLFLNTNQKTAMQVAAARGVILYEAQKSKMKIFEASPPQIKLAITGDGKADKKQIIKMVKMLVKIEKGKKESDDEIDAIAIGLTASASLRL